MKTVRQRLKPQNLAARMAGLKPRPTIPLQSRPGVGAETPPYEALHSRDGKYVGAERC
jgi:hypothetical protein